MAVYEKLLELRDRRDGADDCVFNGSLQEYLESQNARNRELFSEIVKLNEDIRICAGYGFHVNKNIISNQIIRYKDVLKLPEKAMRVPYILYWKQNEAEKGIVLCDGEEYLSAKGYYYCLTEQEALLEQSRNELIAMCTANSQLVLEKTAKFLREDSRAGAIQREVDNYYFRNMQDMAELAKSSAGKTKENAWKDLLELEDRSEYIYAAVTKWYLMKKVVYVSYMMNKNVLNGECGGDVRKQRFNAKAFADSIPFIAYSEMWRYDGSQPLEKEEEQ